jgi:hypothetical protein
MSLQLLFVILALALLVGAAALLLVFLFRRRVSDLWLAMLLMALAVGVWWTSIRTPLPLP